MIPFLQANDPFPDPTKAADHGLLAAGADLSTERLMDAYNKGIFPWYDDGDPICWWSPDPRMVFDLRSETPMKISKSLRQSKRNRGYEIRENTCFKDVIQSCSKVHRKGEHGTWINDDMITAYVNLYKLGFAKSIEVFQGDGLVGGLYGIDLNQKGIFCGESMFSTATDASKIALWYLIIKLQSQNYKLIDAQIYNDHLASLGAIEMDRQVFLSQLSE